jgi:hypothetical protein
MNGDACESIRQVIRLSKNLRPGGLVIFTLKTQGVTTFKEMNTLYQLAVDSAMTAGLSLVASTHLTYNRHELTLFFRLDKADRFRGVNGAA